MTAPLEGTINRDFHEYKNENGGVVRAHVVREDTEGTVNEAYTGRTRDARVGEVLVESGRPDTYTFAQANEFTGVYSTDDDNVEEPVENGDSDGGEFVAEDHTASEVREYLNRVRAAGDTDEYDRVEAAERGGKNRSSAFPVV